MNLKSWALTVAVLVITTVNCAVVIAATAPVVSPDIFSPCELWSGETKMANSLWWENPPELRFGEGHNKVVIADLKGPGVVTMIHFAMPGVMKLNRDVVLRIYWDGEKDPSVQAPLVDFFCDPNGQLERVDAALVNKKRGWNCYFPMPFAHSARMTLTYDNTRLPGTSSPSSPCYAYVMYRTLKKLPANVGYFHAYWRQEALLLGKRDYVALRTCGKGQFIGWNVTVRAFKTPQIWYPVDENAKFYVDGESEPRIEWQGLEDSFGFSFGFPEQANNFPYTGYQPYYNGAAAYRFTLNDRITFNKSLKAAIGFGKKEHPMFREMFSKPENPLEFSSVAYWYQTEPHTPQVPIPNSTARRPTDLVSTAKPSEPGETLALHCGSDSDKNDYIGSGWDYSLKKGYTYSQWPTKINYCWADVKSLQFDIVCPKGASGALKLYLLDPDNFGGGRVESLKVEGKTVGEYRSFQNGVWVDVPVSASDTSDGKISVTLDNQNPKGNAVVSTVRFVENAK